jgi:HEAT repeat protein
MASDAVFAGKVIVKLVVAVLSAPKSKTATAALVVLLYIKAPLVVKLAGFQVALLKDKKAVCPLVDGPIGVKTIPPAVYPEPVISFTVV